MKPSSQLTMLFVGIGLGVFAAGFYLGAPPTLQARPNDRFDDYVMCTGAVALNPRSPTDGVWLLDYRRGKLLGTVIDRTQGKIVGWAEVELTSEFGLPAKSDCHFMMTTGTIAAGQAALYVAEVSTGKFGVYSMGVDPNTQSGVGIRRHDLLAFRK
jgi:hypothetical protein